MLENITNKLKELKGKYITHKAKGIIYTAIYPILGFGLPIGMGLLGYFLKDIMPTSPPPTDSQIFASTFLGTGLGIFSGFVFGECAAHQYGTEHLEKAKEIKKQISQLETELS